MSTEMNEAVYAYIFGSDIISGPSREMLFDGLKYFMMPAFSTEFAFQPRRFDHSVVGEGRILGIEADDDSMHSWFLMFEIQGWRCQGSTYSVAPEILRLYYQDQRRTGSMLRFQRDLVVKDGIAYEGTMRVGDYRQS